MKKILPVILMLLSLSADAQLPLPAIQKIRSEMKLSENNIYILCRGTKSKSGVIAGKFNSVDKNITHLGLAFLEKNKITIYHVVDGKNFSNALQVESLEDFITPDTYYISAWEYKATPTQLHQFKMLLKASSQKKICFDVRFNLRNDDTLYCSEYAANLLNAVLPEEENFSPVLLQLKDDLFIYFLKRKQLLFYPVDFFQVNRNFRKIFEKKIR